MARSLVRALDWPANVWMGVSIENRRFTHRAETLRAIRAAVRFISAEPPLGALHGLELSGIDWLIAGGESGPGHRRMDVELVRELRERCAEENVLLQAVGWPPTGIQRA